CQFRSSSPRRMDRCIEQLRRTTILIRPSRNSDQMTVIAADGALRPVAPCCTMLHYVAHLLRHVCCTVCCTSLFQLLRVYARLCNNISGAASDAASVVAYSCNSVQRLLRCKPPYGVCNATTTCCSTTL